MMRLAAYAGASTALAAGVIIYAFNQRANFYSACVYLSQSNLCLMILTNLILFIIASFMFGLQRMFYGPLRPIEIEQLYEKAWFAVTETCLAMTIFREEVGAWFLVMFVALLAGKVWGWIGEGRIEVLEQQPTANLRLAHVRLSLSLTLSILYDMWLLGYAANSVIQQAKPNMMVMFLFEFAVLGTASMSTAVRYIISLIETHIAKKQTQERLEWLRRDIREQREEILRQRAAALAARGGAEVADPSDEEAPLPSEDDVDEMDIEVPGWEGKGQWVLTLDLLTDFIKLGIYAAFFCIILTFYGLPIHIMRDTFLTARSFVKRLTAFLRYRKATQDMNERYPDATAEEIQREDTCIICREEMRPWSVTNPAALAPAPVPAPAAPANGVAQPPVPPVARPRMMPLVNERSRPKRLPCGHVLHLGCLKSWLERQQACPTCRRPVVNNALPNRQGQQGQGAPGQIRLAQAPANGQVRQGNGNGNGNMRMINIGPLRFAFGQANNMPNNLQNNLQNNLPGLAAVPGAQQRAAQQNAIPGNGQRVYGLELGFPHLQAAPRGPPAPPQPPVPITVAAQLQRAECQIMADLIQLQLNHNELQIIHQMQQHLVRIRAVRMGRSITRPPGSVPHLPQAGTQAVPQTSYSFVPLPETRNTTIRRHAAAPGVSAMSSDSPDLPNGLVLPEGWSVMPLHRTGNESREFNELFLQFAANQPGQIVNPPVAESARSASQTVLAGNSSHPETSNAAPVSEAINGTEQQQAVVLPPEAYSAESIGSTQEGDMPFEAPLPDWGSSQIFNSGASSSNKINSHTEPSPGQATPALSPPGPLTEITLPSSVNGIACPPTGSQDRSHEDESSSANQSKGKARAATVEDADEEEENTL